jgi:hypothetical protein
MPSSSVADDIWPDFSRAAQRDAPTPLTPDPLGLTLQALRRPLGVAPVRARHMLRQSAMAGTAVTPRMGGNAFAAMEYLDRPRRGAGVHLLAEQAVWHRVRMMLNSPFQ